MKDKLGRVAVIAGGLSHEREVSMRSGRRAQYALAELGVDAVQTEYPWLLHDLRRLRA